MLALLLTLALPATAQTGDALEALWNARYGEAAVRLGEPDSARTLALLATVAGWVPDERAARRSASRALRQAPDDPRMHEVELVRMRRTTPESRAFSTVDTRRRTLARAALRLGTTGAIAHEELALAAFLETEWRLKSARRRGVWDPDSDRGSSRRVRRAAERARHHIEAALGIDPDRLGPYRLGARLALVLGEDERLRALASRAIAERPGDPEALLLAGLAAYRSGEVGTADGNFDGALAAMPAAEAAPYLSIRSVIRPADVAAFDADSAAVTEAFWRNRDVRRLTGPNERRVEHLARMVEADLRFAEPFAGRRGWETPRGRTFLRYGEPDRSVWQLMQRAGGVEVWTYPGLTLTFEDPFLNGRYDYASSSRGPDSATRARDFANRVSERTRYEPPGGRFDLSMTTSVFENPDGTRSAVVGYGLPVDAASVGRLNLTSGLFALDSLGSIVAESRREAPRFSAARLHRADGVELWSGAHAVPLASTVRRLSVEAMQAWSRADGEVSAPVGPEVPTTRLRASDVLLASQVLPEAEAGPDASSVVRGGFRIWPLPSAVLARADPIAVYAEAYGLTPGRYRVEAELVPVARRGVAGIARRLLGQGAARGVSVRIDAESATRTAVHDLLLDASTQAPGRYRLTLRFIQGDATAESSRVVHLSD